MYLTDSHKETLGVAGMNETICRDFAQFYSDYDFIAQWADIAEVEEVDLGLPSHPTLAAVAVKGVVMNGRAHEFRYTVHRYNHGPFTPAQLTEIANIAGVPRDIVIMDDDAQVSPSQPHTYTAFGKRIPLEIPPAQDGDETTEQPSQPDNI